MSSAPDILEALRMAVKQRDELEDKLSTALVRLKAAESSRDTATMLIGRCQESYSKLEIELRYARDSSKGLISEVTIRPPIHLERLRRVCDNWARALKDWLATKDSPKKK